MVDKEKCCGTCKHWKAWGNLGDCKNKKSNKYSFLFVADDAVCEDWEVKE